MELKASILFLLLVSIGLKPALAQVGIGTSNPDPAAALEITASDKGLLPPRLTKTQRDNISNPPDYLMIWCSDCTNNGEIQMYDGTGWTNMEGSASAEVGDYHKGGVVFYVAPNPTDLNADGTDDYGLLCAITDQSPGAQWGCYSKKIPQAYNYGIGDGITNSYQIERGCRQSPPTAAVICLSYSLTLGRETYNDWFLPSKNELNEMHKHKTIIDSTAQANGGSNFANAKYWSSTQKNNFDASLQNFTNGNKSSKPKNNQYRVRAIRAY
jgi:hypothetical protein